MEEQQQYHTASADNTAGIQNYYEQFETSNRCQYCGQRNIDRSVNPDSVICAECRESLIRYPIPKKIYAMLALIFVLVVVGLLQFPGGLNSYKTFFTADARAADGYSSSALVDLDELMADYPDSDKIPLKMLDISMQYGYYDYAAYIINTYIVGKELSDYEYDKVTHYSDSLNSYYDTQDAVGALIEELSDDPQIQTNGRLKEGLENLLSDPSYDKALLYYYIGYIASPDVHTAVEYFKLCYELDKDYSEAGAQIGNYYRRYGSLEDARAVLEPLYNRHKEDSSVLRSMAILEMLEGNTDNGLTLAKEAYDFSPEGEYVVDTYIVALAANNRTDEAQEIFAQWTAEDYEFGEDMDAFLTGEMTLEDYYIEK